MLEIARHTPEHENRPPYEGVVITGYEMITPLGNTEESLQGFHEGKTAIIPFDVQNDRTNIAAPVNFDPNEYFTEKQIRQGISRLTAMSIVLSRGAGVKAGIMEADGKTVRREFTQEGRTAAWIASGIGTTQNLIDVYRKIYSPDDQGNINPRIGSRRLSPFVGLGIFPEQMVSQTAQELAITGGWGGNDALACATSAANIVEGARLIREGKADIVFAGGFEDPISHYGEVGIGIFASMRGVLSTQNDDPSFASRPFDRDRDGFVVGAGGGVVVLEEAGHARRREAKILAHLLGWQKSMDGKDPTGLDTDNIAKTIIKTFMKEGGGYYPNVDAIFAHATSTKLGDLGEAETLRKVFGEDLRNIPITAIKSAIGHLAGGSGVVNIITGIDALNRGAIPPIAATKNPADEFADLSLVLDQPLVKPLDRILTLSYGFGGNNAIVLLSRTGEELQAA